MLRREPPCVGSGLLWRFPVSFRVYQTSIAAILALRFSSGLGFVFVLKFRFGATVLMGLRVFSMSPRRRFRFPFAFSVSWGIESMSVCASCSVFRHVSSGKIE